MMPMGLKLQLVKAAIVIAFIYLLYATIGIFFALILLGFIAFIYVVLRMQNKSMRQQHKTGVYHE